MSEERPNPSFKPTRYGRQRNSNVGPHTPHAEGTMGYEFRIRFTSDDPEHVWKALRSSPWVAERTVPRPALEYRGPHHTGTMPDATIEPIAEGLYFCDHGGEGRSFLGEVVALLAQNHCPVTVEDLEP